MRVWKLERVPLVGVKVEVVCLQDLTLKVSGRYLNFWLSSNGSLIKWLTSEKRREREREERERERETESERDREREKREEREGIE